MCTTCGEDVRFGTASVVEHLGRTYHYPCLVNVLLERNSQLQQALADIKDRPDGLEVDGDKVLARTDDDAEKSELLAAMNAIKEENELLKDRLKSKKRVRRRITFVVKSTLVSKLEAMMDEMQQELDDKEKLLMASKMISNEIHNKYSARQIRSWKNAFEAEGINSVCAFTGRNISKVMPWQRATSKRQKSHIRTGAGGGNMDPLMRAHGSLLVRSFQQLVESWGMRCTWDIVTHHFTVELARLGVLWTPTHLEDDDREFNRKKALVRNYLKYHRSRDKTFSVSFRLASKSKHSKCTIIRSVRAQQAVAAEAISRHGITSHRLTWTEDETWINCEGCLINRGLAINGKPLKVRSVSSTNKVSGFMFLTTVDWIHGCRMFSYKLATEAQWATHSNRYKVTQLHERLFQILLPPKKKISRFTHLWIMRAINTIRPEKFLYVYDAAGPHAGAAIQHAVRSFRGIPVSAPMGGWTGVAQLADDSRVHGSLKTFVRSKANRHYYEQARVLSDAGEKVQIKAIPYKVEKIIHAKMHARIKK